MGGHDEAASLAQFINHVLFHVEILHEREVGPIHLFRPDADLVRFAYEAVAVFVGWDIVLSLSTMRVDAHIVGNAIMVIAQGLINAVDGRFGAFAPVGQAEKPARMAMEMVLFPLVGVHVLIGIIKIFAAEGSRLFETVSGDGKIYIQYQQQQGNTEGGHYPAEIKPKAVFVFSLAHHFGFWGMKINFFLAIRLL